MTKKIKICGLLDPGNILRVSKLNPDLMGFIFYPHSPRYVSESLDPGMLLSIPPEIRKAGVFVNVDIPGIKGQLAKYCLDIVQLHGDESPEVCMDLKKTGIPVIKAFSIRTRSDFRKCIHYADCTDYFLFDYKGEKYGGSGKQFDWNILEYYQMDHPFFISGGVSPDDVQKLTGIKNPAFYGVDVNSRFEVVPGFKNITILQQFINEFRRAFENDE